MICIGFCVSHDAGVAIIENGRIISLVQRERFERHKRCALISPDFLQHSLKSAGIEWKDVDVVGISTSQSWPYIFPYPENFSFKYSDSLIDYFPFSENVKKGIKLGLEQPYSAPRTKSIMQNIKNGLYSEYFKENITALNEEENSLWCYEWPYQLDWWSNKQDRNSIRSICKKIDAIKTFHQGYMPIEVTFNGVTKPGLLVPHHLAHAAYAFYQSDAERSAIYTIDNGDGARYDVGYTAGIYAIGEGTRIIPIGPTYDFHGHLYQRIAERLGLGHGSGAGKLMGLAPYGNPRFAMQSMIGNSFQVYGSQFAFGKKDSRYSVAEPLLEISKTAKDFLYENLVENPGRQYKIGTEERDFERIDVDLAASTQWVFEQNALEATRNLALGLQQAGHGATTLCLGGGGALNCPANTLIHEQGLFRDVRVPPACDDSGLPIGAAQAVVHDVFGIAREHQGGMQATSAYRGLSYTRADLDKALKVYGDALAVDDRLDAAADAGRTVAAGGIVGWFEGRSEIGPRALGHRSLLVDPREAGNWRRMNDLKRREAWRPFAPAVLKERTGDWFKGGPSVSPHMLFTAQVRNERLPAITHVDGSARVQTVGDDTGQFRRVIEAFEAETGVPVVLNTSFNGPGEPIVETPDDALRFLTTTELDAVYVDGVKIGRRVA